MTIATVVNNINIDEAFFWLLSFDDYIKEEPENLVRLRAVNNLEPIVSRGDTFEAFPFEITLPPDDGQKPASLKLTFPNVGRELMELVREFPAEDAPEVKLELVLSSDPDIVEKTIDFMQVADVVYDALSITFTLTSSSIFARKTCTGIYSQVEFPGLFWGLK